MSRESSPPLELAPPPSLDRLDLDMWFLDPERAEPMSKTSAIDPALLSRLPSGAEVRAALAHLKAAAPFIKSAARSAFLPFPTKEVLDPDDIPEPTLELAPPQRCESETTARTPHNPYLPEPKHRFRTLARSPLALSLPLTAADLNEEIEPPSRHDWLTLYLATLALFIWVAVLYTALDSGMLADVWAEGFNWRMLPAALTDPVRTWAVVDDVIGVAGVCTGGVCQWTPLV
ncbi:hypothetical protein CC85DRAFT_282945 [Cutaneotrichosporon oleaginosum]|uniref:Uncharacterized protein n=1 Tax=Cutaneotrichosporon oleaginosum TaxID=879819 RepID=A0A0J1BAT9_9TREE|nr:uncharacterized protein CC85DRAFT_282945 [Cutaneotrichosporon oleaginosum]KLT45039.1 hypothetical protein CC85DRAFT_282945 [Cutaneotrichosporon oleaginosum]TXT09725.1 hypothetical protein COLE_03659 [Cutaneotrichosporon oleaginosum]